LKSYQKITISEESNVYVVKEFDDNGDYIRTFSEMTGEEADSFIINLKKKEQKKHSGKIREKVANESQTLENMLNMDGFDNPSNTNDENFNEQLQDFEEEFEAEELECLADARQVLQSVAKLYLDAGMITKTAYINARIKIETQGLSSVLFQLKTSRRALYKISQDIHLGNVNARMIEVMTGLQRVVLDVSKFQHQYMTSLEKSFKDLRDDMDEFADVKNSKESIDGLPQTSLIENVEYVDSETSLTARGHKNLLLKVGQIIKEASLEPVAKSRNERLNDSDELIDDGVTYVDTFKDDESSMDSDDLKTFDE